MDKIAMIKTNRPKNSIDSWAHRQFKLNGRTAAFAFTATAQARNVPTIIVGNLIRGPGTSADPPVFAASIFPQPPDGLPPVFLPHENYLSEGENLAAS